MVTPTWEVRHGDCLDIMREMPDASVDAVVTDPPYGLAFMGKAWDHAVPGPAYWVEALRVLKPGGHLLAFAGTRTQHRMACAIEDAGFEVRDLLAWMYGNGFPKSLDVSKAMDKAAGAEREVVGRKDVPDIRGNNFMNDSGRMVADITAPATDLARQWSGWGTALKPAFEPVTMARKPLAGTVAATVAAHGTGALNIDGCRIGTTVETWPKSRARPLNPRDLHHDYTGSETRPVETGNAPAGRWPANVALDEDAAAMLDAPSRFFYCAKASRSEREAGLEGPERAVGSLRLRTDAHAHATGNATTPARNHHPTVKPVALMRWLVRLVTPAGGVVLDPFTGSGTTGIAAVQEGFRFIGCEREAEYVEIARRRIAHHAPQPPVQGDLLTGDA